MLIAAADSNRTGIEKQIRAFEAVLKPFDWIQLEGGESDSIRCFDWVPKTLELTDCNNLTRGNLVDNAESCKQLGFQRIHFGALAWIQHLQDVHQDVTHQNYRGAKKDSVKESFSRLSKILEVLLGTRLGRDDDRNATLFGRPFARAGLSDGQKVLLQFGIALHAQGGSLADTILLMDEPENHLHPAVLLDVVSRVQKLLTKGQLWIATHSLPLISQFEPESIWYMEEGRVSQTGTVPEKVLRGLLGSEERSLRLASFADASATYAAIRYSYQCLLPPGIANHEDEDPQLEQIQEALVERGKHRILDFGAGMGRLAVALTGAACPDDGGNETVWDYVAYDKYSTNHETCEKAICQLHGSAENRWFDNLHTLLDKRNQASFDVIVMCNVLHEIDPVDWSDLFCADSPLISLLDPEGYLLLVEDQRIPIGEKAHARGFLVLDTNEIRTLFSISEDDSFKIMDVREDGRLKAHLIPQPALSRVTDKSMVGALVFAYRRAKDAIKDLRSQEPTLQNGRLNSFWMQQLANCDMALSAFGKPRQI